MPITKSAAKRLKTGLKRRARNRARTSQLKTLERRLNEKLEAKDIPAAEKALRTCFSGFDKAAKLGIVHPNLASRKKARLTLRFNKAAAQAQAPATA